LVDHSDHAALAVLGLSTIVPDWVGVSDSDSEDLLLQRVMYVSHALATWAGENGTYGLPALCRYKTREEAIGQRLTRASKCGLGDSVVHRVEVEFNLRAGTGLDTTGVECQAAVADFNGLNSCAH
jgi:hypothetical protein